jgi:hypothetical protein
MEENKDQNEEINNSSRNIPEPIKREVRKRCGFGCIICGLPLYQYHHLSGWANTKEHVAEDITLLCDRHHREKHGGLLANSSVIEANKNPFNLQAGVSKPYSLHYSGNEFTIQLGQTKFIIENPQDGSFLAPIVMDRLALISFILFDNHLL